MAEEPITGAPWLKIYELMHAVYPSFGMLAGMELGVFDALAAAPLESAQLAAALSVKPGKLTRLLYVLVDAGLLAIEGERFANSGLANQFLVRTRPDFIGDVHGLLHQLWEATMRTADSIRSDRPVAEHDFTSMGDEEKLAFFRGLHGETIDSAVELSKRFDFSSRRSLLDVGGGSGGLAIGMLERWPNLTATIVELPAVTPITRQFVEESRVAERIRIAASDVTAEPPPGRFDVAVLRALVQVLGLEQARAAIVNVGRAMVPGGRIYIVGAGALDDSRLSPRTALFYDLVFINIYREGRSYTEREYRMWLSDAGFHRVDRIVRETGGSIFIGVKK